MLEFSHVSKAFHGKTVLRDVNFTLQKAEMLCLAGPSGMGKSTLLEIAAGILRPDSGFCRRHTLNMACLLQDTPLLPWRSALQNMDFFLSTRFSEKKRRQKALLWLENMGLGASLAQKPAEMSGGMKRRLALACALAAEPDLLLLDEPFAFLDAVWQHRIADFIAEIHRTQKTTLLMVSHGVDVLRSMDIRILDITSSPVILSLDGTFL
jgi:ABC-type nitrate/sulfonate/bicarbonate transport system ATPase subunit